MKNVKLMDKLIRLINEYGKTGNCWPFETCRIEPATEWNSSYLVLSRDDNWEWDWKDWHLEVPRLISKEYGFIKRLVENDKIDKDKLYKSEYKPYFWNRTTNAFSWFWAEESLLMLLAIQDEPIDLLCNLLK